MLDINKLTLIELDVLETALTDFAIGLRTQDTGVVISSEKFHDMFYEGEYSKRRVMLHDTASDMCTLIENKKFRTH